MPRLGDHKVHLLALPRVPARKKTGKIRTAARLLLVALAIFMAHSGFHGNAQVNEDMDLLNHEPQKFKHILFSNRCEVEGRWIS